MSGTISEFLLSLCILGIGVVGLLLGWSGRVRYGGRASCAVFLFIVFGLFGAIYYFFVLVAGLLGGS